MKKMRKARWLFGALAYKECMALATSERSAVETLCAMYNKRRGSLRLLNIYAGFGSHRTPYFAPTRCDEHQWLVDQMKGVLYFSY